MKQIFFNKYTNWTKDLTYTQTNREDLEVSIERKVSEEEFNKLVKLEIEEVKKIIDNVLTA